MKYVLAILFALVSITARAAMPVEVTSNAKDMVGSQLVYAVKENIRRSDSMKLTYSDKSYRLHVRFVTLDPSTNQSGYSTIYSLVITFDNPNSIPLYLTSEVGTCGANRVNECAGSLVADISQESDAVIKILTTASGR